MEIIGDLLKIMLPSAVMLYAMYVTVQSFLKKDMEKRLLEIKIKNNDTLLPIRLQAYERMCLFLERISPNNLVLRLNQSDLAATTFQHVLISEIREEFNHNLSQQLYMSDKAWKAIEAAKEDLIMLINHAAAQLPEEAPSIALAKRILEMNAERPVDSINFALTLVKDEIRAIF